MAYKALYRTYRPQTFEEVAGQQHIVRTIQNALKTNKIAHAYLFTGPRGTGKTTMAKLLAKALNCDRGFGCQCNECKNCLAVIDGSHPDVIEMDAASNNGVDEIRDLIEKVKYSTILGRYKVYIIDEVHMLSSGAFNALLKTLEEPPEHVIFILCTTEPHKVLPTIVSRCQRYDFSKVSDEDIEGRLKQVLQSEGIRYEEEAIQLITSLADGGMRDALSILDQVIAYSESYVNVEDVLDIFALESTEEKLSLLDSIVHGDTAEVLKKFNEYISRGTDIKRLTDDLLLILKDILIYQTSGNAAFLQALNEKQAREYSQSIKEKDTLNMVDILMTTVKEYKNVSAINPLFEITLLKLTAIHKKEAPVLKFEEPKKELKPEPKPEPVVEKTPQNDTISLFEEEEKVEEPKVEEKPIVLSDSVLVLEGTETDGGFVINDDLMIDIMVSSKKEIKNKLLDSWSNLKRLLAHPQLGKAAGLIVDGHPLVANNKILIVEQSSNKIVENINKKEFQQALQDVVTNAFGNKMFVFAISRADSVRLQKKYMDLAQLHRLPKAKDVKLSFKGE